MIQEAKILEMTTHAPEFLGDTEIHTVKMPPTVIKFNNRLVTVNPYTPTPVHGAPLWAELHMRALAVEGNDDTEWLKKFSVRVPCGECKNHWNASMILTPPDFQNYFRWSVDRHNEVNGRLKKPLLTIDEARTIWSPPK